MKQTILTSNQSQILEDLVVKYGQIVTSGQIYTIAEKFGGKKQIKNLITKLVVNGWLVRIKRELYVITDFSGRGFLSISPYIVANLLVESSYVSFEAALAQYGMFDQLVDKVISVSLTAYKTARLNTTEYSFVKTKNKLYFGWREMIVNNHSARIATREKALIDMVHFHKNRYSIDLVIEKLREHEKDIDMVRFNEYLDKMPSTTIKIFGFIFDLLQIDSTRLHNLVKSKNTTHWMLPDDKKFNAKWRLYYNEYFDRYQQN